jgi:hypothetical protein
MVLPPVFTTAVVLGRDRAMTGGGPIIVVPTLGTLRTDFLDNFPSDFIYLLSLTRFSPRCAHRVR